MKWQPLIISSGLTVGLVVILIVGSWWIQHQFSPEVQARKTLNQILGQSEVNAPQMLPSESPWGLHLWEDTVTTPQSLLEPFIQDLAPFNLPNRLASTVQTPQILVHETAEAYVVKVPLSQPDDEKNVIFKIEPNYISVSAQLPLRTPDGKNILGSSSVMKSLHTRQEILPAKLSRNFDGNTLVVTIPKKEPDEAFSEPAGPLQGKKQRKQQSPPSDLQRKLRGEPQSFI